MCPYSINFMMSSAKLFHFSFWPVVFEYRIGDNQWLHIIFIQIVQVFLDRLHKGLDGSISGVEFDKSRIICFVLNRWKMLLVLEVKSPLVYPYSVTRGECQSGNDAIGDSGALLLHSMGVQVPYFATQRSVVALAILLNQILPPFIFINARCNVGDHL